MLMAGRKVNDVEDARKAENEAPAVRPGLPSVDLILSSSPTLLAEVTRNDSESVAVPARLPAIDLLRVALTWGVLLFHTAGAYAPVTGYYVKSFGWSSNVSYYLSITWVIFMDVWQMPMFFFLSGVSAFHALNRRSEREFREERVHRLLVPWLLLVQTNEVYSIMYVAPQPKFPPTTTFWPYFMSGYIHPQSGQGWFLLHLFICAQVNI